MISSTLQPECVEGLLSYARLFFAQPHSGKVQIKGSGDDLVISAPFFIFRLCSRGGLLFFVSWVLSPLDLCREL